VAVVPALGDLLPQRHRGRRLHLRERSDGARPGRRRGRGGRRGRGDRVHRRRGGSNCMAMAVRRGRAAGRAIGHLPEPSRALPKPQPGRVRRGRRRSGRAGPLLLRRQLGHHGSDHRRPFRLAPRGRHLWAHAHGLGLRRRARPLVIAVVRESSGGYTSALRIIAAIMLASVALPLAIRRPSPL
jgi:hypothetical protein